MGRYEDDLVVNSLVRELLLAPSTHNQPRTNTLRQRSIQIRSGNENSLRNLEESLPIYNSYFHSADSTNPSAGPTRNSVSSSEPTNDGLRTSIVINGGGNSETNEGWFPPVSSTSRTSGINVRDAAGTMGIPTNITVPHTRSGPAGRSEAFKNSFHLFQKKIKKQKFKFYDVKLGGLATKLFYTPLDLNDLMHETKSKVEMALAPLVAGLVAFSATQLSYTRRPMDIFGNGADSFLFDRYILFLISAAAQYALIKSPVPDAASPVHGYSPSMAYARGVYFILLSGTVMVMLYAHANLPSPILFYGYELPTDRSISILIEMMRWIILLLPISFCLGLYPQLKTFFNFLLEQIEVNAFGGSGSSGVASAAYSLLRSLLAFLVLLPILYYACENSNHDALSFYLSLNVAFTYQLSRQTNSNPEFDWIALKTTFGFRTDETVLNSVNTANIQTLQARLQTSVVIAILQFGFFFLITAFNVFTVSNQTKPLAGLFGHGEIGYFSFVMVAITAFNGLFCHYFIPRMRQLYPWGLFKAPCLRNSEWSRFEATEKSGKILWFEKLSVFVTGIERHIIFPLAILNEAWIGWMDESNYFIESSWKTVIIGIATTRLLRQSFRSCHDQWLILLCSHLLKYDLQASDYNEPVILTWFIGNIVYTKILGCYQRLGFVYVQLNPGTTWGSAFHAVAQPLSIPHSGWLFVQSLFSTLISAPLKPIGGSTIFMTSYVRTLRFWEKNYNTKLDSNVRLETQLEFHRKKDENGSKNALFYENLAFSLKKNLAGDVQLGRYGNVKEGDVFILASSSTSDSQQNGLIQIVEISNGVVSFQFRGLEFKVNFVRMVH